MGKQISLVTFPFNNVKEFSKEHMPSLEAGQHKICDWQTIKWKSYMSVYAGKTSLHWEKITIIDLFLKDFFADVYMRH